MADIVIHHLTISEIYNYLSENDLIFIPPLSTRIDVQNFAVKLNKYAVHFCAFEKERLVGFTGCYFNNPGREFGFISSSSVMKEFQGRGVAKALLAKTIEFGINNGFKQIKLQVNITNLSAVRLYSEAGFIEVSRKNDLSEMTLNLK